MAEEFPNGGATTVFYKVGPALICFEVPDKVFHLPLNVLKKSVDVCSRGPGGVHRNYTVHQRDSI